MKTIFLNDTKMLIADDASLFDVLREHAYQANYALAINGDFVPKSAYSTVQVEHDDKLELLVPMQGG